MIQLSQSLAQWPDDSFKVTLKQELEALPPGSLPLHLGTQRGGQADDRSISVLVNMIKEQNNTIEVHIGVFFYEIMGGCSCGDEPPSENTYCEMLVNIDISTAEASFKVPGT